ncbi:MAG TPA: VOC family protein [Solirubrobacteraceae bacterium]|nr:VOC family protein [Solirubrobacteraceae bacterium]
MPVADHIERVDHVAIALPDIAAALPLVRDGLGAGFIAGGDNPLNGLRVVHFQLPGMKLELLAPLREDSLISEHLAEHGAGLHHITIFVDDLPATIDAWDEQGMRTVGTELGSSVWKETFLHPADTFGALLQFVQTTRDWTTPTRDFDLQDVLAGRVQWKDFTPCLMS